MARAAHQAQYPAHWEADVLLLDGGAVRLRPIQPGDADGLVAFYARVSPESKYWRFFAPYPTLSARDVERFTTVDHTDRVALVMTLGRDIVAVGRYEKTQQAEAEVAFLVEDSHQGRGIAQLLLEHLAQAGRERGIARFVAEVLPDNVRMISTFRDAGYSVAAGLSDGVLRLVFPIDSTDTAVAVMRSREHRAEKRSMERFMVASSVVVIGAGGRQDTHGRTLVRNLVLGGYTGQVYVVNPGADSIADMPAYKSVRDVPGRVDLAIVSVAAEAVHEVVLDAAAKGVHGLIVVSSSFAETGEEGRLRQRRLVGLARSYGLRLVGPNCLGVINTAPEVSLNASLSPVMPPTGRVGIFSQSGALGRAILEGVASRSLGVSTFVSAGNRADVSGNDLLQYWEEDDATEVVLVYLESIGNPRKFSRIARRVGRGKPVVAVKSGRSTQGVPMGHTVRPTLVPPAAVDALFRQAGVIQVETLDEMLDVAQLLAHQPLPTGPRVAVVGNSGALALLAADAASAVGLIVDSSVTLGVEATAVDFERAMDEAVDASSVHAVIVVVIPPINTSGATVAAVLAAKAERSGKPIVSTFLAAEGMPEPLRVPDPTGGAGRGSVPSYATPEAAVRALGRAVSYSEWVNRPVGAAAAFGDIDRPRGRALVDRSLSASPRGAELDDDALRELLASYGIPLTSTTNVMPLEEAGTAGEQYSAQAGFVPQPMAPRGLPLAIGSLEDTLFGPVVSCALAGAPSDLLGEVSYRIPPLTETDAADLVGEVLAAALTAGYRAAEPVDVGCVEELVLRLAQLKDDLPQVQLLNLNLFLAGAEGAEVRRATGRVVPVQDARSDQFARRLAGPLSRTDTLPP